MTLTKQAGLIGLASVAIALMVYSFYISFLSGPKPAPPSEGRKWEAIMKRQGEEWNRTHPRTHSPTPAPTEKSPGK
jgi:hypothetical protein